MKTKKLMLFAFRVAVAAAFAAVATLPLAAQDRDRDWHQLRGTYFTTGENLCLVSPAGFSSKLIPVDGAYVQSSSVQGILKFHANGTGTGQQFEELMIAHPTPSSGFSPSAGSDEYSFPFTYTVADDGVLTFTAGLVSGTFPTGPFTGLTFSLTPPQQSGQIARDRSAITLTSTVPTVETVTLALPPPPAGPGTTVAQVNRICYRTRVLIPVHVPEDEDEE
jgi:hypothetical protein